MSITPQEAIKMVAEHHGVTVADLKSPCRKRDFAWPRQEAMYVLKHMGNSYAIAGNLLGWRDHTTAMHAVARVTKRARHCDQTHRRLMGFMDVATVAPAFIRNANRNGFFKSRRKCPVHRTFGTADQTQSVGASQ